jgi:hypothetical protein
MKNLLIVIILFLCVSCTSTKYVEVPIETIKTEYVNKLEYKTDSIFVRDSIDKYIKGDTVYIEKYKTTYKYKDRVLTDTVVKTDSIQVPVYIENTKEVNKLKGYQYFLMYSGITLFLLIACIIYRYIRKNLDKIKRLFS